MAGKYKQLSRDQRVKILTLTDQGLSYRQISVRIGCSHSTIVRLMKKKENLDPLERTKGSGRKRKTNSRTDKALQRMCLKDRFKSAVRIRAELKDYHQVDLSAETIRRRLREIGLYGRRPAKKPLLTKKMKDTRLTWAKKYKNWTKEDWRRVIWSDESKFNLLCADNFPYVRRSGGERFNEECTIKTVKFAQSQMVWGCFSFYTLGPLHFVDGTMNAQKYGQVIKEFLVPAIEEHLSITDEVIFQDDSAPCHRAKSVS